MTDGLLAGCVLADLSDREVHFGQSFTVFGDHLEGCFKQAESCFKQAIARRKLSARCAATAGRQCFWACSISREG
jgi:hypothetical protein